MATPGLGTSIFFGNTIVTRGGITVDGTNVLDKHSPWVDWTPTVVSGHVGPLLSTAGTKYKQIGDAVTVLFNVDLVYTPGGPAAPEIVFGGLPVPASKSAEYCNGTDICFEIVNIINVESFGRLELDPGLGQTQITVRNFFNFIGSPFITHISGELKYKADC